MELVDNTGKTIPKEYLVTYQVIFRVHGQNKEHAQKLVDAGMSFRGSLAPLLVGMGIQAVPLTIEALKELGYNPNQTERS